MSIKTIDLLRKKFYLEKYAKLHNIEQYTLNYINKMWDVYCDYIDKNKGKDIDYPDFTLKFK